MKLDDVIRLATGLARSRNRGAALDVCRSALQPAFLADAAVLWLPAPAAGATDDLLATGVVVPPASEPEIRRAATTGRLRHWLGGRGVTFYSSADVPMPKGGPCGLVAVAWRESRFMHVQVDDFIELVAEELGAVLAIDSKT